MFVTLITVVLTLGVNVPVEFVHTEQLFIEVVFPVTFHCNGKDLPTVLFQVLFPG